MSIPEHLLLFGDRLESAKCNISTFFQKDADVRLSRAYSLLLVVSTNEEASRLALTKEAHHMLDGELPGVTGAMSPLLLPQNADCKQMDKVASKIPPALSSEAQGLLRASGSSSDSRLEVEDPIAPLAFEPQVVITTHKMVSKLLSRTTGISVIICVLGEPEERLALKALIATDPEGSLRYITNPQYPQNYQEFEQGVEGMGSAGGLGLGSSRRAQRAGHIADMVLWPLALPDWTVGPMIVLSILFYIILFTDACN